MAENLVLFLIVCALSRVWSVLLLERGEKQKQKQTYFAYSLNGVDLKSEPSRLENKVLVLIVCAPSRVLSALLKKRDRGASGNRFASM